MGERPARLGILVVHNDPVPETEIRDMAVRGAPEAERASVHAARFECPRPQDGEYVGSAARALADSPDVRRGLDHLGQLGADNICLCFGSSSFFGGTAFDAEFVARAREHSGGVPVFTAAVAIAEALRATGVRRPLVVMPPWFTPPTFAATEKYLAEGGVEGVRIVQFELGPEWSGVERYNAFDEGARWVVRPDDVRTQVLAAFGGDVDGVLIPGSGMRAQGAVAALERELDVPVITANQAALWFGLRTSPVGQGMPTGSGRLFELLPAPRDTAGDGSGRP
ncbi:maleate cis-trans isomerase family protein [Streptomyces sp. SP18CS02]|uniref:maleate cis-trans isomerase family protein n=1 Tax=Streptomyces sp. SP18CS02 TaxID=3002531 RepID=UPI002E795E1E|nr:hypothetical protein [Streptomyces sp. SP18CS02]MEE1752041.1 hypothetical protein [Streptomyces sp. SP18CS02]